MFRRGMYRSDGEYQISGAVESAMVPTNRRGDSEEPPGASVSVIIPCYNAEKVVREAVESALAQTTPPLEIVCVDDGSKDGTLSVLHALQARNRDRVTVLSQPRGGAPSARNSGLQLATGTYVQFLDADDILLPKKLDHQLTLAQIHRNVDIVAGSFVRRHLSGEERPIVVEEQDSPWISLPQVGLGITSANLYRREAILQVGGWNESYPSSQEYELMFRMLANGCRVAYDKALLTIVRQQPRSITTENTKANIHQRITLGAEMREYIRLHVKDEEAIIAADAGLFHVIRMFCRYDMDQGMRLFHRYFGETPGAAVRLTSSPTYSLMVHLLGFQRTEKIRAVVERISDMV